MFVLVLLAGVAMNMAVPGGVPAQAQEGPKNTKASLGLNFTPTSKFDTTELAEMENAPTPARVRVFIQLAGVSAAEAAVKVGSAEAKRQAEKLVAEQKAAEAAFALQGLNVKILGRLRASINGFIAEVDSSQLRRIATTTGVRAIFKDEIIERELLQSVPKVGAPTAWTNAFRGEGMRIAVIDDGIDYKHANFGGSAATTFTAGVGATPVVGPLSAKVVGGYDLVGDLYDARGPISNPLISDIPSPDDDPLTCRAPYTPRNDPATDGVTPTHHGTHVAGIALGYGVTAANATYTGAYDTTTHTASFKIGPGMAPLSQLLAFRVFGCWGSTSSLIVAEAIDMAVDPDGNGDPSDHADVINMSLGSSYGSGYGPYQIAIENAMLLGTLVVSSAGNSADSYFVTGNPGAVGAGISVAGSAAGVSQVTFTNRAIGPYYGTTAAFGPALSTTGISGTFQLVNDGVGAVTDACSALAGFTAGNIAVLDRGTCEFDDKVWFAQQAGATAAIVCNNSAAAPIPMGAGTVAPPASPSLITIPSLMLSQADCNTIKANLPGATGTVGLSSSADAVYTSTSRGPRRSSTQSRIILKPDVAAPGQSVISSISDAGGTNAAANYSGTSMASPHVAGFAALLRQQNPTWSTYEIKALIMNTAINDIPLQPGSAILYGPGRIGSGRINVPNAMNLSGGGPKVIAYDQADPTLVSLSFGMIEAIGTKTVQRVVELKNKGGASVTYNVGLQNVIGQSGTVVSVSPSSVTVPAGGTATVTVTIAATPGAGAIKKDATVANTQGGLRREWLPEVTGYVTFTATSQPTLRVAYHSVVRPASLTTVPDNQTVSTATGSFSLPVSGQGFTNLAAFSQTAANLYDATALTAPFQLTHIDANEAQIFGNLEDHADIQYVGVSSDYAVSGTNAWLFFGIANYAEYATPKEITARVYIDTNFDNIPDHCIYTPRITSGGVAIDVFLAARDTQTNADCVGGGFTEVVNPVYANTLLHTYQYGNNLMVIPMPASSLSLPADRRFQFKVEMFSNEYFEVIDDTAWATYDLDNEVFNLTGGFSFMPWYLDDAGENIPVSYNLNNFTGTDPLRLLVFHFNHNQPSTASELVCVNSDAANPVQLPVAVGCEATVVPPTTAGSASAGGTGSSSPSILPATGFTPATSSNSDETTILFLALAGLALIGLSVVVRKVKR